MSRENFISVKRLGKSSPAKHSALYSCRHMGNVPESGGFFKAFYLLFRCLAPYHSHEDVALFEGIFLLTSYYHSKHDISRCLRNGAAVTHKCAVGDDVAVGFQLKLYLIASAGVYSVKHNVRIRNVMLEVGVHIVFGQYLIIKASVFHIPYAP